MSKDKEESPTGTGKVLKIDVEYDEHEESLKPNVRCPFCSMICHSEKAIRLHLFNSHRSQIEEYIIQDYTKSPLYNLKLDWVVEFA